MENFTAVLGDDPSPPPASDAELTFLCDYMSVGQQYSQYFASAEGRSRLVSGSLAEVKQTAAVLKRTAASQVNPPVRIHGLVSVMGEDAVLPALCSQLLLDAVWVQVAACCQYLHKRYQQRGQAQGLSSAKSSTSSSRPIGSRGRGGRGEQRSSGSVEEWLELNILPDHQLLPVPGGQLAVTTQVKTSDQVADMNEELKCLLRVLTRCFTACPCERNTCNGSSRNSSSSSWLPPTAFHLQLLLEAVALSGAEGDKAGSPENFLPSLNTLLVGASLASADQRQAFLAARGKLLLEVLMVVGRAVDRGEVKELTGAVPCVLECCLRNEDNDLSGALSSWGECGTLRAWEPTCFHNLLNIRVQNRIRLEMACIQVEGGVHLHSGKEKLCCQHCYIRCSRQVPSIAGGCAYPTCCLLTRLACVLENIQESLVKEKGPAIAIPEESRRLYMDVDQMPSDQFQQSNLVK